MSLTSDDKKHIAMIFHNMTEKDSTKKVPKGLEANLTEWIFRALLALLLYVGNNIRVEQANQGESLQEMKASIIEMNTEKQYYDRDIENFRTALAKPRFTREDYNAAITPLITQLNENTAELNSRSSFLADHEKRLTHIEYLVEQIEEAAGN